MHDAVAGIAGGVLGAETILGAGTAAAAAAETTLIAIEAAPAAAIATPVLATIPSIYNSLGGSILDVDETGKPNGYAVLDQKYDEHSPFTPFSYKEEVGPNLALNKTAIFTLSHQKV